jgi:hypothetical protein
MTGDSTLRLTPQRSLTMSLSSCPVVRILASTDLEEFPSDTGLEHVLGVGILLFTRSRTFISFPSSRRVDGQPSETRCAYWRKRVSPPSMVSPTPTSCDHACTLHNVRTAAKNVNNHEYRHISIISAVWYRALLRS